MPEPVLYRRYRPQSFAEVLGQDEIVRVLEAAGQKKLLHHAYLFTGPRGTGKTSVARLLARAVDCAPADLYEIDAASHRGIDEIRHLRESVRSLPVASPYKVYIIDEVHMITRDAWNAFLKTLEEPPAHVIFILATTEPHKILETVLSRCQVFNFRRPTPEIISSLLIRVAKQEGYALEPEAAALLGTIADGSFRDALGWLEKCLILAPKNKKVTGAVAEAATEAPSAALVESCLNAILERNLNGALGTVAEAVKQNREMKIFTRLILRLARFALLFRLNPERRDEITKLLTPAEQVFAARAAAHPAAAILVPTLRELLTAVGDIDHFHLPQLPLELALIKILT